MENLSEKIKKSYITFVSSHQKQPSSISSFVKELEIEEDGFKEYFSSFESLEKVIWADFIEITIEKATMEEVYIEYSGREKLLSIYFTLMEELKKEREFTKFFLNPSGGNSFTFGYSFLADFKEQFIDFAHEIINEAADTGEVLMRPILSEKYVEVLLYPSTLFILKFWAADESENYEKTDALIEKTANLAFDLMGSTPLDTAFDLAKFVLQNKWWK